MKKLVLTARHIGNSVGIIIPKKLGINAGEKLPSKYQNGQLDINLQNVIAKKRGEMINKGFEHLNKSLNERQMTKRFGKEGW